MWLLKHSAAMDGGWALHSFGPEYGWVAGSSGRGLNLRFLYKTWRVVWTQAVAVVWDLRYILINVQLDETVSSLIYFTAKSLYVFRVPQHPSSGVLKSVTAASGTGHNIGRATSFQRGQIGTESRSGHVGLLCYLARAKYKFYFAFAHLSHRWKCKCSLL